MLYDLVISEGEEEIEKPDLTVVFYTDIAASCVPVYANQTWSFLHMILSTGPQSFHRFDDIYFTEIQSTKEMLVTRIVIHIENGTGFSYR